MFFSEFNSRCQVDLIDFQFQSDRENKFIMVYQDHLTKFVIFKCLTSKRAEEVAYNLVDICPLLGSYLYYSLTMVRNLLIMWWPAWRSFGQHWRSPMESLAIHKSRVVSKELIKMSKICLVLGCNTINVTVGVKDCFLYNLCKIELGADKESNNFIHTTNI